jgi:cytoskeletal protein RodZ
VSYADFGKYLTRQRELRGLSREEVAHATRIPGALIGALEEGELSRLPGRVFVVNYIRSYAEEIGLSPDEAVLRFEEIDLALNAQDPSEAVEPAAQAAGKAGAPGRRWLLWLVLAAVLAVAAVGVLAATGHLPLPPGRGR